MFSSGRHKWAKIWTAPQSLTNCAMRGWQYTFLCEKVFGVGFSEAHFIFRRGVTTLYRVAAEQNHFKEILGQSFLADHNRAKDVVTRALNWQTKIFEYIQSKNYGSEEFFRHFREMYDSCAPYNIAIKWAGDAFTRKQDPMLMFIFESGRRQLEQFYPRVEKFLHQYHELLAMTLDLSRQANLLMTVTDKELFAFLRTWRMPVNLSAAAMAERYEYCLLSTSGHQTKIFTGGEAVEQIKILGLEEAFQGSVREILGTPIEPGVYHGRVRLVRNLAEAQEVSQGEVAVSEMIRPDWALVMKSVSAVVTDIGGNLSHAAILCRELKIPCVVGTQVATQVLQNGDLVEVDANLGSVRKIA